MDKISRLYYKSSYELGLEPEVIKEVNGFRFTLGGKTYYFRSGFNPFNDLATSSFCCNKFCINKMLNKAGVPVPKAFSITRKNFKKGKFNLNKLNFPVVAKPTWDTVGGKGVICNIKDKETLLLLLEESFKKYRCMSIEEYHADLRSYRVTVFLNKVIGVVERIPASVVGDGVHTISQLIDMQNSKRKILHEHLAFGPIKITKETDIIFEQRHITPDYIPGIKESIPIRITCNSGAGGTMIGLDTNIIHPENANIACLVANVLNLKLVGVDFLCEDISVPFSKSRGVIIEANPSPDITLHEKCPHGVPLQITKIILKKLILRHIFSYLFKRFISLFRTDSLQELR